MRITYFALKQIKVGDDIREPGDLVPECADWAYLSGYVSEGQIAPVLIATLPEEQQIMLLDWADERAAASAAVEAPAPTAEVSVDEAEGTTDDETAEVNDKEKVA